MDAKKYIKSLQTRLAKLDEFELREAEKLIARFEPEGKKAFQKYLNLKQQIRNETDDDNKTKLIEQALKLGHKYNF